ncbi:hypothetical protein O181_029064 [Austropuccinia psidii MF-1]|uniref:Uncharacterized protein n=1 Tax=Austropuccinia psidii MF-1 TaxID=1389203 RepID=A0A9Q3CRR7_9BASI|nr:hypothetical protein [Austropuccinia psidii MF-1]
MKTEIYLLMALMTLFVGHSLGASLPEHQQSTAKEALGGYGSKPGSSYPSLPLPNLQPPPPYDPKPGHGGYKSGHP